MKTNLMLGMFALASVTVVPASAQMAPKMTKSQMAMAGKCKAMSHAKMMKNKTCMSMQKNGMMSDAMMSSDQGMMSDGSMKKN